MLSTLVSLALFSNKTAFNNEIKYALGCCYFKFESKVIDTPMQWCFAWFTTNLFWEAATRGVL